MQSTQFQKSGTILLIVIFFIVAISSVAYAHLLPIGDNAADHDNEFAWEQGFHEGARLSNTIHFLTGGLAVLMAVAAFLVHQQKKKQALLFIISAFLLFAASETLLVLNVLLFQKNFLIGISHLLVILTLGMFFVGIRKF